MIISNGTTGSRVGKLDLQGAITTANNELASIYSSIKDDGGVLIFTVNPKDKTIARDYAEFVKIGDPNYISALVEYLAGEGYDVEEPIVVTLKGKCKQNPNLKFLIGG